MYTNEGVPATTLHVSRLTGDVKRRDLLLYFGRFGPIFECCLKESCTTKYFTYAMVTFEKSVDALRASRKKISINGVTLRVVIADFWYQKTIKIGNRIYTRYPSPNTLMNGYANMEDEKNILNVLNEYCLVKIFSYLPLKKLIMTESVSKHWNYIVHEAYKGVVEIKASEWDTFALGTTKLHLLLYKVGGFLKTLNLNLEHNKYINKTPYIITKLCPNLNKLVVTNLKSYNWKYLNKLTKLKTLQMYKCNINDYFFKDCTFKLEELVLSNNFAVIDFLTHLDVRYIKKLSLIKTSVQLSIATCMCIRNLKELHIEGENFNTNYFVNILKLFPQLESLNLSPLNLNSELDPVSNMKQLKVLRLHSKVAVNDAAITMICLNCPKLTELDISNRYSISEITLKGFNHIWSLENLRVLNLSGFAICGQSFLNFLKSRIDISQIRVENNNFFLKVYICKKFDHMCKLSRIVTVKNPYFWWYMHPLTSTQHVTIYFCKDFNYNF